MIQCRRPEHSLIARHLCYSPNDLVGHGLVWGLGADLFVHGGEGEVFEVEKDPLDVGVGEQMVRGSVVGGCGQEDNVPCAGRGDDHGKPALADEEGCAAVYLWDTDSHFVDV